MKNVYVQVNIRNTEGDIVEQESAPGTTVDDGVTVIVPIGYLPNINKAQPSDILLTVSAPSTQVIPTGIVDDVSDEVSGSRTLTFTV